MPVTFISNSGTGGDVPAGGMIFMTASTAISGFTLYSTFDGYFLAKGTSTGGDGGYWTHNHTSASTVVGAGGSHSHTASGDTGSANDTEPTDDYGNPGINVSDSNHGHSVGITTGAGGSHSNHRLTSSTLGNTDNNPAWMRLYIFKADSPAKLPDNAIVMWYGNTYTKNSSYKICDGTLGTPDMRSKFVRIGTTTASGGSNAAHSHTGGALNTITRAHTHSVSGYTAGGGNDTRYANTDAKLAGTGTHSHGISFTTNGENPASSHGHPDGTFAGGTLAPPALYLYFLQYQE